MIDNLALALSHGLLILAAWRLLSRPDLNDDTASPQPTKSRIPFPKKPRAFLKKPQETGAGA